MPTKKQPKPEPVKETAPKKAVKKKVVKPAAQRVAEPVVETAPEVHTIEIAPQLTGAAIIAAYDALKKETLPAPEQHGEPVAPVVTIEPEPAPEPTKLTIFQRWHNFKNSSWFWVTIAVFALIILWAVIAEIRRGKINKGLWKTQQTETKITDEKEQLKQTEKNLSDMQHNRVDSNYKAAIEQLQHASDIYEAYHAKMVEQNAILKKQNDAIQARIADANDDTLRRIGSELSGR